MKFVSRRGSREKKQRAENTSQPYDQMHPNRPKGTRSPSDEAARQPLPPPPTEKLIYPESSLSARQMQAINSVIRPSEQVPGQMRLDSMDDTGKIRTPPVEAPGGAKRVFKIIFVTIFIVAAIGATGYGAWYWWWTNHATFNYTVQPTVALYGQDVTPNDFLEHGPSGVAIEFLESDFEPHVGLQYVPLKLTYGLRSVETNARLYVLTPYDRVEREFGEDGILMPADFISNVDVAAAASFDLYFIEEPLPQEDYQVGEFTMLLALNDTPFEVTLIVADTTPPTAITTSLEINVGEEIFPEDFIEEIFDASDIQSVFFARPPDFYNWYPQTVEIVIEDIYGNIGTVFAELTIIFTAAPPVVEGVIEVIEAQVGTQLNFLHGVAAFDYFGREIEVHVDSDDVDVDTAGSYIAIVWAEDYAGFRTEFEVAVHIHDFDPEEIYQQVDDILEGIIDDEMTQAEQVEAIHEWVTENITSATSDFESQSVVAGAYRALEDRDGNALIFSAISSLMLTRADIPNMLIERTPEAEYGHRWNLVNPDERGWFHFDSYPTGLDLSSQTSMFTNAQARDFARRIYENDGPEDYYTFIIGLFPEIVIAEEDTEDDEDEDDDEAEG